MERNLCKLKGCKAGCCQNIEARYPTSEKFFLKAFPGAQKLESQDDLKEKIFNGDSGVYYFPERGYVYYVISGLCPNYNSQSWNCNIHDQPYYPRPCANMNFESQKCGESRMINGINEKVSIALAELK